jgi:nucleoside phosphorylase
LERAVSVFHPEIVLFIGVAGGRKDVGLGDVVIADEIYDYESGKDTADGFGPRIKTKAPAYRLVERAKSLARDNAWQHRIKPAAPENAPKAIVKPIAAGSKVIADENADTAQYLARHCGDAAAVEMEGYGFLHGAYINTGIEALVVRGISDLLSDKTEAADHHWQPVAAAHAAAFAFELVARHATKPHQHVTASDVPQMVAAITEALKQHATSAMGQPDASPLLNADVDLHVEQLLDGLSLDGHEEAERRVNRLFLTRFRSQQRAVIEAIIRVAKRTEDHTTELLACSLLEAADRLDPTLITTDEVESLARSAKDSLRSGAAVLMWQWAESNPGRVPIALLGRLTQPSTEDWYVHAAARAGAKQLLLARSAARAIFDRMAASHDVDDRDYAVIDLLDVARVEPRAVPVDLARKLARDEDKAVAARAAALLNVVEAVGEQERGRYHGRFGM